MRTCNEILAALNDEQKVLLADTLNYGLWGDCDFDDDKECGVYAMGYITNDAYRGGHFERKTLSARFRSLFKALGLKGTRHYKKCKEMKWFHDWWGDGSGSVLLIRQELCDDFEEWARIYRKK